MKFELSIGQSFVQLDLTPLDSLRAVSFSVVGDLMCHATQFNYAKAEENSFDFKPVFREIKKYFNRSDFVMGNLETVIEIEGKEFAGYPVFNTPKEFLEGLKDAGFNFLFTSNNHVLDHGRKGVESTVNHLNDFGFDHHGAFLSQKDNDSIRIYSKNDISFAMLSYSYSSNGKLTSQDDKYLINFVDTLEIRKDFERVNKLNPDFIFVYLHIGTEYEREPSSYQKDIIKHLVRFGADLIISSHTHTIQPIDYFTSDNATRIDTGFIAYSLGNFISNQRWRYSDAGVILNFSIMKNKTVNSVILTDVSYVPTWVYRGWTPSGKEYVILPAEYGLSDSLASYVDETEREKMKESYLDTIEIITKYSRRPRLNSQSKSSR